MNEHIKANKVANMCFTTPMTKRSHCRWKYDPFFLNPQLSLNSSSVFSVSDADFHGRPLRLRLELRSGVFSEVNARAIDLVCVQKYIKDVNSH